MSQLSDRCRDFHILANFKKGSGEPRPPFISDNSLAWTVTLTHKGLKGSEPMTVPFYTGRAVTNPTVADVLSNLLTDASGYESARNFEEWCSQYGYDSDSRKALATYEAIGHNTAAIHKLLGKDYNFLATLEH